MSRRAERISHQTPVATPSTTQHATQQSSPSSNSAGGTTTKSDPSPGFLGSTSYSAVYTESQQDTYLGEDDPPPQLSRKFSSSYEDDPSFVKCIEKGVAALRPLKYFKLLEAMSIQWYVEIGSNSKFGPYSQAWTGPIKDGLVEQGALESDESLRMASRILCEATAVPLIVNRDCKFKDFPKLWSGSHLRWEVIGRFFIMCGIACSHNNPEATTSKLADQIGKDRLALRRELCEASNACLSLCKALGQVNDIYLWSVLENGVLASLVLGDEHYEVWQRVGDISTALFAMGLHQHQDSPDTPFWLQQIRRRIVLACYAIDKSQCTFLGRPPRISRRYCSIQMPLELDYKDFLREDSELQKIIDSLDSNGWRTDGKIHRSGVIRCLAGTCLIREDVLELCLGPKQDDVADRARDIIKRNQDHMLTLPPQMRYFPAMWYSRQPYDCYQAVRQYLDIKYNDFMIQRVLIRQLQRDPTELLRIAREMMTAMVEVVNHASLLAFMSTYLPWMIDLYGIPSAGVLALELLRQSQPRPVRSQPNPSQEVSVAAFPRSEIIQNLSIFVACLDWAHDPDDGNYKLAQEARTVIKKILDKILNTPPVPLRSSQQSDNMAENTATSFTPQKLPGQHRGVSLGDAYQHEDRQDIIMLTNNTNSHRVNETTLTSSAGFCTTGSTFHQPVDPQTMFDSYMYDFSNSDFDTEFWANLPDHPLWIGTEGFG